MAKYRKRQFVSGYIDLEVEASSIEDAAKKFAKAEDIGAFTPQGFADTYYSMDAPDGSCSYDVTEELGPAVMRENDAGDEDCPDMTLCPCCGELVEEGELENGDGFMCDECREHPEEAGE
jgi:hypothetical protein